MLRNTLPVARDKQNYPAVPRNALLQARDQQNCLAVLRNTPEVARDKQNSPAVLQNTTLPARKGYLTLLPPHSPAIAISQTVFPAILRVFAGLLDTISIFPRDFMVFRRIF